MSNAQRTRAAQDASFEAHGNNDYQRMIAAYAFASELENEIDILMAQQKQPEIPPDCDVRKIMIAVVPGDGSGEEVYAKSVDDVRNLLTEMSMQLDELTNNTPKPALARPAPAKPALNMEALFVAILKPLSALLNHVDTHGVNSSGISSLGLDIGKAAIEAHVKGGAAS